MSAHREDIPPTACGRAPVAGDLFTKAAGRTAPRTPRAPGLMSSVERLEASRSSAGDPRSIFPAIDGSAGHMPLRSRALGTRMGGVLERFGYLAVFGLLLASGLGVPLPEEVTQIAAGVLALPAGPGSLEGDAGRLVRRHRWRLGHLPHRPATRGTGAVNRSGAARAHPRSPGATATPLRAARPPHHHGRAALGRRPRGRLRARRHPPRALPDGAARQSACRRREFNELPATRLPRAEGRTFARVGSPGVSTARSWQASRSLRTRHGLQARHTQRSCSILRARGCRRPRSRQ